jgi:hypothetical protein
MFWQQQWNIVYYREYIINQRYLNKKTGNYDKLKIDPVFSGRLGRVSIEKIIDDNTIDDNIEK